MIGKIYSINSGKYYIKDEFGEKHFIPAAGVFRHKNIIPLVGDIVFFEKNTFITDIKERKNSFIRPKVSNVDHIIIVMSLKEPSFQSFLVDKYMAMIESKNIEPILFITKVDLGVNTWKNEYEKMGYKVFEINYLNDSWIGEISKIFKNKTNVLMGQSGVGKTTILNKITNLNFETQEISKFANRGKHTTRIVQIVECLEGELIDTPGFSSLEINLSKIELASSYKLFKELGSKCKFKSCLHENEPEEYCNVKLNVKNKKIPEFRYNNYLKLLKEINYEK